MSTLIRWLFAAASSLGGFAAGIITRSGPLGFVLFLVFQLVEGAALGWLLWRFGSRVYNDIDSLHPDLFAAIVAGLVIVLGAGFSLLLMAFR